jgi:YTH domain-containing protein 1
MQVPVAKQGATDSPSSVGNSPITRYEQECNINELISQYADSNSTIDVKIKQEEEKRKINPFSRHRLPTLPNPSVERQLPSLGTLTKVTKPVVEGNIANNAADGKTLGVIHSRDKSMSEISEGEIPGESTPPKEPKETQTNTDTQSRRKAREPAFKPYPLPPSNSKAQPLPSRDDMQERFSSRQEKGPRYPSDCNNDQWSDPDSDKQSYPYHQFHDQNEEYRKSDIKGEQNREDNIRPAREARLPTLAQLLPHSDDLREWLEITGYHNVPYRDKILKRRRAIAELDAQRSRLLAEIEADERAGIPVAVPSNTSSVTLAPTFPNKAAVRAEPTPGLDLAESGPYRDYVVSNKRSYSDIRDPYGENGLRKTQRTDDRHPREDDITFQRPKSSYESLCQLSSDYSHERDSFRTRYDEGRGYGRRSSRERGLSPDSNASEHRLSLRMRSSDRGLDDCGELQTRKKRPFVVRGGYRGRAFDPNYRGRGGGSKGRGDFQPAPSPFASMFENVKP